MKKFFSTILLLSAVLMLSSCIIYANTDEEEKINYYDITCYNDSDTYITDWCVVRNNTKTFAKSILSTGIHSGSNATLYNLPEGRYIVYVAFVENPDYDSGDYIRSKEFTLNKDYPIHIDQTFADEYWDSYRH